MQTYNTTWRFIDSGAAEGAFNMAADEMLARESDLPVFRVYGWQPHAISIGYHQRYDDLDLNKCEEDGIGVVRRPTGGRAIFHAHEVTYSVVIPKQHELYQNTALANYNLISTALVRGLNRFGLPAELQKKNGTEPEFKQYQKRFSCFATSAKYEIHYQGKKLVGSAQRRFETGLLQHGSILLGDRHLHLLDYLSSNGNGTLTAAKKMLRQKTATVESILMRHVTFPEVVPFLKQSFEEVFSVNCNPHEFTDVELDKIMELQPTYMKTEEKRS